MPERDRGGSFDLKHALAVSSRVDGLDAKLVALLHDAIEDGHCTLLDLHEAEIPDEVLDAVGILTRDSSGESYLDYIDRICESANDLAIYVKLADLDANLARMDADHASLAGRYRTAEMRLKNVVVDHA